MPTPSHYTKNWKYWMLRIFTIIHWVSSCSDITIIYCLMYSIPISSEITQLTNIRQEAHILKFNATPPPPPLTHSVCHVHLTENFLSFHVSLILVVNYGAGNALRGFKISMFYFLLKLYLIRISKDILLLRAQNAIKQCKWYFYQKAVMSRITKM